MDAPYRRRSDPVKDFATSPDYVIIPGFGSVPLFNFLPHPFMKFGFRSLLHGPDSPERPVWVIVECGWQLVPYDPSDAQAKPSAFYSFGKCDATKPIHREVIHDQQHHTHVAFKTPEGPLLEFRNYLHGKAIICLDPEASIVADFKKYGIHVFVPDPESVVYDGDVVGGSISGWRRLLNATRY